LAFAAWTAEVSHDDILAALDQALTTSGFHIDEGGTTSMQVSALKDPSVVGGYWSNVRLVAMWENKSLNRVRIEIRSDEPLLRATTHCSESAKELQQLLPPI
jgi:hypothetical protein